VDLVNDEERTVMHVRFLGGGTAWWDKPVQIGPQSWRANFQASITHRLTFDSGQVLHVRTRYAGVDDVELESDVAPVNGGFGHVEGLDQDGDRLWGRVDWVVQEGYQGGRYSVTGGTGKWEGASGLIEAGVWAEPENDEPMPHDGPILFWGFVDGEGELEMPAFR